MAKKQSAQKKLVEEIEKKEKTNVGKIFHKWSNNLLIITVVGSILATLTTSAAFVYKSIQAQLNDFESVIVDLIIVNEDQYIFCNTKQKTPVLFQSYALFTLNQKTSVAMKTLLKKRTALGSYISYNTYLETAALICWNEQIYVSGILLCDIKLKPVKDMDHWRNVLIQKVETDKERHQELKTIIGDYSNFMESFFFPGKAAFEHEYHAPKCDHLQYIIDKY